VDALKAGCFLAIPTETVYGLAANALDEEAAREIFRVKGRPLIDPLIVHVDTLERARELATFNRPAQKLAEAFWPGPLTLILQKKTCVPDLITAGHATVALRCPAHAVARDLLNKTDLPLAAPSANPFGYVSATRPEHVARSFGPKVPFILDGGPCKIGVESTILDLSHENHIQLLRPGAISRKAVEDLLGKPVGDFRGSGEDGTSPKAPGMLKQHYSPACTLRLFEGSKPDCTDIVTPVVFLVRPPDPSCRNHVFWLSENLEPEIIAANLFDLLRRLDEASFRSVDIQLPSAAEDGLLMAVRDRLLRAAASNSKTGGP